MRLFDGDPGVQPVPKSDRVKRGSPAELGNPPAGKAFSQSGGTKGKKQNKQNQA